MIEREQFLSGRQRVTYQTSFRLTQTERVSGQVGIHELVEFVEELRRLAHDEYGISVKHQSVNDHDVSLTLADRLRHEVADRVFESDVEALAEDYDIGLCKLVGLHTSPSAYRYDGGVFVEYAYGWGHDGYEEYINDPNCPISRVDWVGGYRGQPETMSDPTLRIASVDSSSTERSWLSGIRESILALL